jgi:hypothetical protein
MLNAGWNGAGIALAFIQHQESSVGHYASLEALLARDSSTSLGMTDSQ